MYAVIGTPGSVHHKWAKFEVESHGSAVACKQAALNWLERASEKLAQDHPAAFPQPTCVITNKEARKVRYQDGTRVYEDSFLDCHIP